MGAVELFLSSAATANRNASHRHEGGGFRQCHAGHSVRWRNQDVQQLGEDESYRLEVTTTGARLSAPTTLGVMRGLQTFLQLVQTTRRGLRRAGDFHRRQPPFSLAWI